jgi:hypothetical protein
MRRRPSRLTWEQLVTIAVSTVAILAWWLGWL